MDAREKQIAPPKSWETFEDLCLALFKCVWHDPLAQKNGRRGQPQHGVDVFGSPTGRATSFFGVQCKGKDQGLGSQVTVGELETELAKADRFQPALAYWVFATTAPTDVALQEAARKLSLDRTLRGHFPLTVLGWGDLQALLIEHRSAFEQFYPEVAFDFPALMAELRRFSTGPTMTAPRRDIAGLDLSSSRATHAAQIWQPVKFEESRDLGPALMGRPLGPADVGACPILPEAKAAASELERAFSARLEGRPGAGKSVCALQAAKAFTDRGWSVVMLSDPRVDRVTWLPADGRKFLYIIDDAHLTADAVLRAAEAEAGPSKMLLSTHNAIGQGRGGRGAIVMDAKRAVEVIAAGLRANRASTLAVVRRADDRVGDRPFDESLDQRLDYAEEHADRPWQFCFILGGGWRRAEAAANAARNAEADVTLAAVAIRQLASRDARPGLDEVQAMLLAVGVSVEGTNSALNWLIDERLVLGPSDLRTPHQRFAIVVLGRILAGQNEEGRRVVGALLNYALENPGHPLAGLRLLLRELRWVDHNYRWEYLVQPARLSALVARCWDARTAEERTFAMLILAELSDYMPGWPQSVLSSHLDTLADWFSSPADPSGYSIGHLTNSVRQADEALAIAMVAASDPERVAAAVSTATPSSAYHLAEMTALTSGMRPDAWKEQFANSLNRESLVALGRGWPEDEPVFVYAKFCAAINRTDETLALDMVEAFLPAARRALAKDTVTAFHELDDIASAVLRVLDVLGVYIGKYRPSKRARRLATQLCSLLEPATLASQLSVTRKRDFQQAAMLLSFLSRAAPTKFKQSIALIDWNLIAASFDEDWSNLFHDAQVFLGVCFSCVEHRRVIAALIERNAYQIDVLAPRMAIMNPAVAYRHLEQGRRIALCSFDHVDWHFGAGIIAHFADERADLLDSLLKPAEATVARTLSQQHQSWYEEVTSFMRLLRQVAPQSLDRILSQVNIGTAEIGWAAALAKGGAPRRAVAFLVEMSIGRDDAVGDMARRLRARCPRRSVPNVKDLEPFA
jgi:hypothetical protein